MQAINYVTEKAVKLTIPSWKTVWTTTSMMWSRFNDLQHNVSWCKIRWNVQKPYPPGRACTFSFCHETCFLFNQWWCVIYSQADSIGLVHSKPVQCTERAENVLGYCSVHYRHQLKKSFSDSQFLINSTNKNGQLSYVCNVSALINCNAKYKTNDISFSWLSKSDESWEILSAVVFLSTLILVKACRF